MTQTILVFCRAIRYQMTKGSSRITFLLSVACGALIHLQWGASLSSYNSVHEANLNLCRVAQNDETTETVIQRYATFRYVEILNANPYSTVPRRSRLVF